MEACYTNVGCDFFEQLNNLKTEPPYYFPDNFTWTEPKLEFAPNYEYYSGPVPVSETRASSDNPANCSETSGEGPKGFNFQAQENTTSEHYLNETYSTRSTSVSQDAMFTQNSINNDTQKQGEYVTGDLIPIKYEMANSANLSQYCPTNEPTVTEVPPEVVKSNYEGAYGTSTEPVQYQILDPVSSFYEVRYNGQPFPEYNCIPTESSHQGEDKNNPSHYQFQYPPVSTEYINEPYGVPVKMVHPSDKPYDLSPYPMASNPAMSGGESYQYTPVLDSCYLPYPTPDAPDGSGKLMVSHDGELAAYYSEPFVSLDFYMSRGNKTSVKVPLSLYQETMLPRTLSQPYFLSFLQESSETLPSLNYFLNLHRTIPYKFTLF